MDMPEWPLPPIRPEDLPKIRELMSAEEYARLLKRLEAEAKDRLVFFLVGFFTMPGTSSPRGAGLPGRFTVYLASGAFACPALCVLPGRTAS